MLSCVRLSATPWTGARQASVSTLSPSLLKLMSIESSELLSLSYLGGANGKEPSCQETQVWSLGQEDPLEKEMATHSNILAWRIPWTEEPGGL